MSYKPFLFIAAFAAFCTPAMAQVAAGLSTQPPGDPTPFQLVSIDLVENQPMADMYVNSAFGCQGQNKSPVLSWSYPPDGTRSFAVTMFDTTARGGEGWLHWFVMNIPTDKNILQSGIGFTNQPYPDGATLIPNSWGNAQYDGPCPPVGDKPHKYVFTVYAMPEGFTEYPLNAIGWSTIDWLSDNALAKASITTTYQRLP